MPYGVSWKSWLKDLAHEISEDNVTNGAAALAYYLTLSIFPMMIALLSLMPYLPIPHLESAIMDFMRQALPADAFRLLQGTVQGILSERKGGLLTLGLVLTLWSGSSGIYAVMQQLNITYDVKDGRGMIKARAIAIGLMLLFGLLTITAFALIIFGGYLQDWLGAHFGIGAPLLVSFAALRWVIIVLAMLLTFALMYYLGPDVEQEFRFITPGSVAGVVMTIVASLIFKIYVTHFSNYSAAYGSLGAVIILMLWLYIVGLVILLGSEVNALVEHYSPEGKVKGEKVPAGAGRPGGRLQPPKPLPT